MGNFRSVLTNESGPEIPEQQVTATGKRSFEGPQGQQIVSKRNSTVKSTGIRNDAENVGKESYQSKDLQGSGREQVMARSNPVNDTVLHRIRTLGGSSSSEEENEVERNTDSENSVVATGEQEEESDSYSEDENGPEQNQCLSEGSSTQLIDCLMDSDLSWSSEEGMSDNVGFDRDASDEENLNVLQKALNNNPLGTEQEGADEESDIEADLNHYSEDEEETGDCNLVSEADVNRYTDSKECSLKTDSSQDTKSVDLEMEELDKEALMLYESYWKEHCESLAEEKLKETDMSSDDSALADGMQSRNENVSVPVMNEDEISRLSEKCRNYPVQVKLNVLQFRGIPEGIEWISAHEARNGQVIREAAKSKQCPLVKYLIEQYELELRKQKFGWQEYSSSSDTESISDSMNNCFESLTESTISLPTVSSRSHRTRTFKSYDSRNKTEAKPDLPCPFRGEMCTHKAAEPCPYRAALVTKRKEKIEESKLFKPLKRHLTKRIRLPLFLEEPKCLKNNCGMQPSATDGCLSRRTRSACSSRALGRTRVPAKIFRMDTYSFELPTELPFD